MKRSGNVGSECLGEPSGFVEGGPSQGMENDVVYDPEPRVGAGMELEIDVGESGLGHGEYCLVQWAVNGIPCGVVEDVGDDAVSCPVVSPVSEFLHDYRLWVYYARGSLDCLQN